VRPGRSLADQSPVDLVWIREPFLSWREPFEKVVVHGHTPVREPEILPNRINLDTGAFATGRLTAAVFTDDSITLL
jgi:serine/threonine protein phosphatase 1